MMPMAILEASSNDNTVIKQKGLYMRKTIISGIIASVFGLLAPQIIQAQGTTYLSNLDQSSVGSVAVGSDSWLAGIFNTGTNYSGGYVLNSIQLAMASASGNPSGFQVMLYASTGGSQLPRTLLATLDGSLNPVTSGIYTYTPDTTITLPIRGFYDIVLTAGTAVGNGAYEWSAAGMNSYNPSGDWNTLGGTAGGVFISSNGSLFSWIHNGSAFPQFAINATAVPEPGVFSLFALCGFFLVWRRRKAKVINAMFFTSPRTGPHPSAVSGLP
jgi:hypothetical protein